MAARVGVRARGASFRTARKIDGLLPTELDTASAVLPTNHEANTTPERR